MRFFEAIPSELFSPLASPNRALYADALDVLYSAYRDNLKIREDALYSMLRSKLEEQLADATFEGEDIARIAHSINHIFNSHERCPQNCIIYGAKASTFLSKTAASGRAWVFFYGIHPSGKTEAFCMEIDTFQKLKKKNIFSEKFSDSSLFIILLRK